MGTRQAKGPALLARFLKTNHINYAEAGRGLKVSRVTVYHWAIGSKDPTPENQDAIAVWTSGAVPSAAWPMARAPKHVEAFRRAGRAA